MDVVLNGFVTHYYWTNPDHRACGNLLAQLHGRDSWRVRLERVLSDSQAGAFDLPERLHRDHNRSCSSHRRNEDVSTMSDGLVNITI